MLEGLNTKNKAQKKISKDVINAFIEYSWPGNIRQLKNVMERMFILSGDNIELSDLPKELLVDSQNNTYPLESFGKIAKLPLSMLDEIEQMEKNMIREALKQGGSIRKAASLLGITPSSLYRRMKKLKRCDNATNTVPETGQNFAQNG